MPPRSTDRLPGMAFVIDRVDLLGYLASGARVRDPATGTHVASLAEVAAYYLHEPVPQRAGEALALTFWEPGYDLVVKGGASLGSRLVADAQVYATGWLRRCLLETQVGVDRQLPDGPPTDPDMPAKASGSSLRL